MAGGNEGWDRRRGMRSRQRAVHRLRKQLRGEEQSARHSQPSVCVLLRGPRKSGYYGGRGLPYVAEGCGE